MSDYVAHNMTTVDIPELDFSIDTRFTYQGYTIVGKQTIMVPGVPENKYSYISVGGSTYKVASVVPPAINVFTDFKTQGQHVFAEVKTGYAQDDGRNISNWKCDGLTILNIERGRVTFEENMMVGRVYVLTLLNPIVKSDLSIMPRGTEFTFYCNENFEPTALTSVRSIDGVVIITFSNHIMEDEGYIYGIDFDRIEYDENRLLIYTSMAGELSFDIQDFVDIYGNPIEDAEINVHAEATVDTLRYLDESYHIRKKSYIDYEDVVLAESYQWLKEQEIE